MPATLGNPLFLSWMYLHTGRNEDLSFLRILMDYSISSFDFIYYSSIAVVPHSRNFTPMFRKHVFPPTDRRYLAIFCEIPHRIILFSSIFNSYELKILVDLSSRTTLIWKILVARSTCARHENLVQESLMVLSKRIIYRRIDFQGEQKARETFHPTSHPFALSSS